MSQLKIHKNIFKKTFYILSSSIFLSVFIFSATLNFAEAQSKEQLQAELQALEKEIADNKAVIDQKKKEGQSLSRDIGILDTKIKKSEKEIQARDINIKNISYSIEDKNRKINSLNGKLETEKTIMQSMLREMNRMPHTSLAILALSSSTISAVFDNVNRYEDIKTSLHDTINAVKDTKNQVEEVKKDLVETKSEEQAIKQQQLSIKKDIEENKKEKATILTQTKGQEKLYQQIVKDKEKRVKEIRSALFTLSGSKSINFGQAYDIAKQVEKITGIRAAYLLGIITVESNLGQNVGKGNWKEDMHPTRDQPLFQQICDELGLNPDTQPVSKKAWYGYGGAMGPAQFIPSTWVSYKGRISAVTGHNPPNPWNNFDAFVASALLLKDNGAVSGNRQSEHRAAVCYLAGCGNASKSSYQFYGNDVLKYADKYESQIDILNN